MHAKHRRSNRLSGLLLTLTLLLTALTLGVSILPRAVAAVHPNPVVAAWERARTAGSYHFASDVVQQTIPSATIANVGRSSRTEKLRLEGPTDLRRSALELRLWGDGGSVLQDASGVGVRVENGKTWVRQGAGEWKEAPGLTDSMAPQGDFMAYLVAVREVTAHAPETRGGIGFSRYSFRIDGPSWAGYMRDQLEAAMRQKGELQGGVQLDVPQYYRDMRGAGELWVGRDGLPLRQILDLRFPEQHDERVEAHITVDFSQFGQGAAAPASLLDALQQQTPAPASLLGLLAALTFVVVLVRFHRSRRLYNTVVAVVIASLVAGPVLNGLKISSFMETQAARAAAHEQQRAESDAQRELRTALAQPNFDPHANPLVAGQQRQEIGDQRQATNLQLPVSSRPSPVSNRSSAPNARTSDTGADTDGDGLTDFAKFPQWNPFIQRASCEPKAGARLEVTLQPSGASRTTSRPTVLKAEPNHELRWIERSLLPGLLDVEHIVTIELLDANRVRFTQREIRTGIFVPLRAHRRNTEYPAGLERVESSTQDACGTTPLGRLRL